MIDRQIWRRLATTSVMALLLACLPASGLAFLQNTDTAGQIRPDLTGTWLVVNRLEFPRSGPEASPVPGKTPSGAADDVRPFTVAYLFTFQHLPTAEAQKLRDADQAKKQASVAKATKILAQEQRKSGTKPKPVASAETPVEPKVLSYRVTENPDSGIGQQDEVTVQLLDVDLPKGIQDAIDQANKAETPWNPSEEDLATLKSSWRTLKPRVPSEYSSIKWKVLEEKFLEESMRSDEKTKNAKFVIAGDAVLVATRNKANRSILVYGADKVSDRLIEGGHVRAIMTAAPFPTPSAMKGTFAMYRLTDMPKAAAKTADQ